MSVRSTAIKQYQSIVDRAASTSTRQLREPAEGWIATVRKALGMTGPQLGKRLGLTRARISQAERAELSGGITVKTLQAAAEAMGCRFVYAFVPVEGGIKDVVAARARKKAHILVERAGTHMALEKQSLPEMQDKEQVELIAQELTHKMPADLWADD